jgi:hypothetical protein
MLLATNSTEASATVVMTTDRPSRGRARSRHEADGHSEIDEVVAAAAKVSQAGGVLDLSKVVHGKNVHASAAPMLFLGWWLLGADHLPSSLALPATVAARRVLARFGILFAAQRRGVPLTLNGSEVSVVAALRENDRNVGTLPGFDWKNYDDLIADTSGVYLEDQASRLRVIADLEDPARSPVEPDDHGRRYYWVDGLGASTALGLERQRFNGDVDQVLFESISNVHEWADANRALATCSVTLGGGVESHNRLHIVVIDDGVGIPERVSRQRARRGLESWQDDTKVQEISRSLGLSLHGSLLHLIFDEAFGARALEPIDEGHGLHTVGFLAHQWTGTVNLFTSSGQAFSWMRRIGRDEWRFNELAFDGCKGTALHVTLEARPEIATQAGDTRGEIGHRDLVSSLS